MKVQLIYTPTSRKGGNPEWCFPPMGILYLAAYVRELYPEVEWKVSDGQLDGQEKCLQDFRTFNPDLVGVSFSTIHANGAYELINRIKMETPHIPVICGGPHPSAMPDEVLEKSRANGVVAGEGEVVFAELVGAMLQGKDIFNEHRILTGKYIEDIDILPLPARDLIDHAKYPGNVYRRAQPEDQIIISRGCPYNCTFCSNRVFKVSKPWCRLRSPEKIVDEIEYLQKTYGIRGFTDQSDEFNVSLKHAIAICDELMRRNLKLKWKTRMTARAASVSEELFQKMAAAGCWFLSMGIESGNQETLDGIGKAITLADIERTCLLIKKYGMISGGTFMLFNAWEEDGKLKFEGVGESLKTISFARKLLKDKLLDRAAFAITTPFPASPLWDACKKFGLLPQEKLGRWELWDAAWKSGLMQLPGVSEKDVVHVRAEAVKVQAMVFWHNFRYVNIKDLPMVALNAWRALKLMLKDRLNIGARQAK